MAKPDKARITNYRKGTRTQMSKEVLIKFEASNSPSSASTFVGKKVVWKEGQNRFVGRIIGVHGKSGMLKVRFVKGVPGQAIGQTVELLNSKPALKGRHF